MARSKRIGAVVDKVLGVGNIEMPGATLDHCGKPGMQMYSGALMGDYRFRIYVPTTIYDGMNAQIRVYEASHAAAQVPVIPEKVVAVKNIPLDSLPRWDIPLQALLLDESDENNILSAAKKLERELHKG